jgi:RNA polymerase sporulation-specific sigma factor
MSAYKVEICGVNTAKLPILKEEEKDALFARIKQGDTAAREEYIKGNLRLVLSIIRRFSGHGENIDDLFQIGCIGLMKSIDNFDPTMGVKFSTYAVPMILGEIKRYLRDGNSLRVSRSIRDEAYKVLKVREKLEAEDKEATIENIAGEMNVAVSEVVYALDAISDPVSLYDPVYNKSGDALLLMDQIYDEKNNDEVWTEQVALSEAMNKLQSREKKILFLRYYEGKTQTEISKEVGISQAQVSRLEKSAIDNIRNCITAD